MMNRSKGLVVSFLIVYFLMLLADWGGRLFTFHFGFHSAHFYMLEQIGERTLYYRPNACYEQTIHGYLSDLLSIGRYKCHHRQRMVTDSEGLRKSSPAPQNGVWPVTVVGDSFAFGSYNSDEDILSMKLEEKLQVPVRNFAFPNDSFLQMVRLLVDDKPLSPLIIWGFIERNIRKEAANIVDDFEKSGMDNSEKKLEPAATGFNLFKEWFEIHAKDSLMRFCSNQAWGYIKFYILNDIPKDLWTPLHPKMLFYREGVEKMGREAVDADLDKIVSGMERLAHFCRKRGAKVIVLLIPDKSTVYPEYVNDPIRVEKMNKNRYLDHLETRIKARGLPVINLQRTFWSNKSKGYLYYPDDTHWNPFGISAASEAIVKHLSRGEREAGGS